MSEEIRYSSLTLYKDLHIIPSKNFIVDSIEDYLSTWPQTIVIDQFQYLRPTLEMTIKIYKQENFCSMVIANNYNYLRVYQDNRAYYYFIIKKTQRSQEAVELDLRMDTINTFRYGSDFYATERTKVLREHKDRFEIEIADKKFSVLKGLTSDTEFYFPIVTAPYIREEDYSYSDLVITGTSDTFTDELYLRLISPLPNIMYELGVKITFEVPRNRTFLTKFTAHIKQIKRKIDLYSEGLTPILYKEEKGTLYPPELNNWYLIYKNKENPQPGEEVVDCYLAPESPLDCKANTGNTITPASLDADVYYLFSRVGNASQDTIFKTASGNLRTALTADVFGTYYQAVILRKSNDGTKILAYLTTYTRRFIGGQWVWTGSQQTFSGEFTTIQWLSGPLECYKGADISTPSGNNSSLSVGTTSNITLNGFSSFDRTLSTILKIIAIPYLPCNYEVDSNGVLILPQTWEFDSTYGFMKLSSLDEKFESLIQTEVDNPFTEVLSSFYNDRNVDTLRTLLDSKLYHSDYYQPKFIYDSFGFVFQLEKMNPEVVYNKEKFEFTFVMTSTIRSRFMFKFEDYDLKYSTEDYDNILSVNRNNEAVIYNSAYITYLRTGYNIDVKAKERTQRTAIIGGVLSTIGSIAGIGLGRSSQNPAVAVKGAISGTSSIVSTIVNSINTIAQSEESMEKNLATLKAQAVSVEGSDDLDLLENYSENKAKLAVYKVSPKMESILDDLFYYTGYIAGEMKVPNITSRYWFNFLSCDLDITGANSAIPELCLNDLFARYQSGVFFLHKQDGSYNFELNKENWEISLL